jgi:hypothetical protein
MKKIIAIIVMAAALSACSPYFNQANVAKPAKGKQQPRAAFR